MTEHVELLTWATNYPAHLLNRSEIRTFFDRFASTLSWARSSGQTAPISLWRRFMTGFVSSPEAAQRPQAANSKGVAARTVVSAYSIVRLVSARG
jgi:hypothetical protein